MRSLQRALIERGHDVTRTPNSWMPADASAAMQMLGAIAQGRCLFTFNIRDFLKLASMFPHHHGIILAQQRDWRLSALIMSLDRLLSETEAEAWMGQIRWLNDWR